MWTYVGGFSKIMEWEVEWEEMTFVHIPPEICAL